MSEPIQMALHSLSIDPAGEALFAHTHTGAGAPVVGTSRRLSGKLIGRAVAAIAAVKQPLLSLSPSIKICSNEASSEPWR